MDSIPIPQVNKTNFASMVQSGPHDVIRVSGPECIPHICIRNDHNWERVVSQDFNSAVNGSRTAMGELPNSEFMCACRAVAPLVIQRELADDILPVILHRPYAVIGHSSDADINLESTSVLSPKFGGPPVAYLQVIDGCLFLVDLRPSAKTDPTKGPRTIQLRLGRALQIGPAKLRLISGVPVKSRPASNRRLPSISLKEQSGMTWAHRRPITWIGSAAECHVRITDPEVPRFHTALVCEPSGVWVVSLFGNPAHRHVGTTPFIRKGETVTLSFGNSRLDISVHARRPAPAQSPPPEPTSLALNPTSTANQAILPMQLIAMQQQMFSQFQTTIDQLVQTFGTVHRDQMDLMRREMDRVERLDREIAELRLEQARLAAKATAPSVTVERLPPHRVANPAEPLVLPMSSSTEPNVKPLVLPVASSEPGATPAPPPEPASAPNVHAWLDYRVAQLQHERQTIWSKIAGFFTNMPSQS